MGKQGPCYHCGVTSTPLWRNGPPEKPVLCNACGSRWRTKGTLANYTPLHARIDADDYEDNRISKVKSISLKKRDEKLHKRKLSYESYMGGRLPADLNHSVQKSIDEDTSYRSSSGSAISNSENSAQFGSGGDASDLTGPAYSNTWEKQVPSRKRTCVTRPKQSPVEKLTKDLRTILHEQSFYLAASPEDDLLFESDRPMVSVEIGHGSVLMKHPSSLGREEESEASSLSVENKHCADSEAYYHSTSLSGYNDCKGDNIHFQGDENFKKISNQMIKQETAKREKFSHERMQQLWHCNSPLHSIDLKDVVNFEVLVGYLTREEQHHLLRYLPSTDTYSNPDGLRSMFESRFFKEDISSFQQLVAEGLFSNTFSEVDAGDLKSLKKLVLSNLSKSKWLELYAKLKENRSTCDIGELSSIAASGGLSTSERSTGIGKKRHDPDDWNMPETKPTIKSPIRRIIIKNRHPEIKKEPSEAAGSYFSSKSLLETMPASGDGQLLMLDSYQFADESSEQDILLDIPANGSFPEAEFLLPSSGFTSGQPSASSSSFHPMFHP